jgi:hypothetical protein
MMALSTTRAGDLDVVTPGSLRLVVASIPGVPGAGGALQGTVDVEVLGASPG